MSVVNQNKNQETDPLDQQASRVSVGFLIIAFVLLVIGVAGGSTKILAVAAGLIVFAVIASPLHDDIKTNA